MNHPVADHSRFQAKEVSTFTGLSYIRFLFSLVLALPASESLISPLAFSLCRSDYDDWRPALASLLQPIPFPKE